MKSMVAGGLLQKQVTASVTRKANVVANTTSVNMCADPALNNLLLICGRQKMTKNYVEIVKR
jgi:hypothetical protein